MYVVYQKDDALIVINTNICNGSHPSACATLNPPEIHTGADPEMVALDPQTQTLYTANQVDNDVSVIDASRCDAQTTSGCRQRVPEVPIGTAGPGRRPGRRHHLCRDRREHGLDDQHRALQRLPRGRVRRNRRRR